MTLATRIWAPERPSVEEFLAAEPAWKLRARCVDFPHVDFFPRRGEPTEPAKSVCAGCRVKGECLEYALEHAERGVWGGLSERERRKLRRVVSVSGPATHCVRGHPYDEKNTRVVVRGDGRQTRACRVCAQQYNAARYAARGATAATA